MLTEEYHKKIVEYYNSTENAYKDSWDLNNSLAIHYGYWDEKVRSFPQSLLRMNEVMIEAGGIATNDKVLDAGCGVGGSSIFIASQLGCRVTGITLSERQAQQASSNAKQKRVEGLVDFKVMNYCSTSFANESFDIVWGCESICYADDKDKFIKEAFRLLKPGGRLIIADGFVTRFENNDQPVISQWLDGWQVNYLESPDRFSQFMQQSGFINTVYRDISKYTAHSSKRLLRFYYLANLYLVWKKLTFSSRATEMQKKNIRACKYQYYGMKKGLWQYGLITGKKP
jgi:tocopherol O-methyltransferase